MKRFVPIKQAHRFLLQVIGVWSVGALLGCGAGEPIGTYDPGNIPDSGTSPTQGDAGTHGRAISVLRESFETREWIETSSVAYVDVNRGVATLPVPRFPEVGGTGAVTFVSSEQVDSAIAHDVITVEPSANLEARDTLGLFARDSITISGRIRGGPGGVRIAAGRRIEVSGTIESEGPIWLWVQDLQGEIRINDGEIRTRHRQRSASAPIQIRSRGKVILEGRVESGSSYDGGNSGAISITAYGGVYARGPKGELASGSVTHGTSGAVEIWSEHEIVLEGSSTDIIRSGVSDSNAQREEYAGGDVLLTAPSITLRGATVRGGDAQGLRGGSVSLVGTRSLVLQNFARVEGGRGRTGGNVTLDAKAATIGSDAWVLGGDGFDVAGRTVVATAEGLLLTSGAHVRGGDGLCANGGDAVLVVGGRLVVDGTVELRGGDGGTAVGNGCLGTFGGGHVEVVANAMAVPTAFRAYGGEGMPNGAVQYRIDSSFSRRPPTLNERIEGYVISKLIDRGEDSRGYVPDLVDFDANVPAGTEAWVELRADDGPLTRTPWLRLDGGDPRVERLKDARFFRYRVALAGRRLDAPEVAAFTIRMRAEN